MLKKKVTGFLGRFSRITTPGRVYIPHIDGLRFLAIMSVVAFHVNAVYSNLFGLSELRPGNCVGQLFATGHFGVQLFFTISGFVLAIPFFREMLCGGRHNRIGAYYLRRLTRLEPPYIIQLVIFLFLTCFVLRYLPARTELYHNPEWLSYTFEHFFASLFYSHGFVYGTFPMPNYILWSLEVEVQFYLLVPVLVKLFFLQNKALRRSLLAGSILVMTVLSVMLPWQVTSRVLLLSNLQYFLGGFLLADIYLTEGMPVAAAFNLRSLLWDVVFLIACAGIVSVHYHSGFVIILPWIIFMCCMAAFRGRAFSLFFSNPLVTTIGGMCYTTYMYHWFITSGVVGLGKGLLTGDPGANLIILFVMVSAVLIPACAVLFVLFERPFMRKDWPVQLWAKFNRLMKHRVQPGV